MRSNNELQEYRSAAVAGHDRELIKLIEKLTTGDESVRETVEEACDQIDKDAARYNKE